MDGRAIDLWHDALLATGRALQREGYHHVTCTPETHRRTEARAQGRGKVRADCLRDVFGWSRPFAPELLPLELLEPLRAANLVSEEGSLLRARVRFSTLAGRLFAHSPYPTLDTGAVFFGPDTYRFCALLERWAPSRIGRLVDVGCGSGAGGLSLAGRARHVVLADINRHALAFARVNAELCGEQAELVQSDVLQGIDGAPDVVVANPPYLRDPLGRTYRDGGGDLGEGLSLRIVREALERLGPHGVLILYTGAAIVDGRSALLEQACRLLQERDACFEHVELDPDVFGEELDRPEYETVERISVVALRATLI